MNNRPITIRLAFTASCLVVFMLFFGGCTTIDSRDAARGGDELPWNSPANWESGSFGVPY